MERWCGKIAVVTGASCGIGASVSLDLVKSGMVVIGVARRLERIQKLRETLPMEIQKNFHGARCDLTKEMEIKKTFEWIITKFGGIDVLVNNAGVERQMNLIDPDNTKFLWEILDTNLMALVFCTRETIQSMLKRSVDGHIIHVNSISGHKIPNSPGGGMPSLNLYTASKHAITALTEVYRGELITANTNIKVSSISPGLTRTELFSPVLLAMITPDMPCLRPEDVSDAILFILGTPPHVQIHELILKPLGELF